MNKGTVKPDGAVTNQFEVEIGGLIPIVATRVSGLESMLTTAVMPDQTVVSTGSVKPTEDIEIDVPAHHDAEVLALEGLYQLAIAGGPLHKLGATVYLKNAGGKTIRSFILVGLICKGRKPPDFEAKGDGEGAMITFKFACDQITMV